MHHDMAGEWEAAFRYALQAIAIRKNADATLLVLDFCSHYETEALLYGGDERQAREAVHRLGERLGPNRRFRVPYLRSRALLSTWDGHSEHAIGYLREAPQIAADLRFPAAHRGVQAA